MTAHARVVLRRPAAGRSLHLVLATTLFAGVVAVVAPPVAPAGAQSAPMAGIYVPLTSSRLLDTRQPGAGGAIATGTTRQIQVTGAGGVPTSDVLAVVFDLSVVNSGGDGWGLVWQGDVPRPTPVSSINYVPGRAVTNAATTKVSATGSVSYYTSIATDLVVDVVGYYRSAPGAAGYVPLTQTRIFDSRSPAARLAAGTALPLKLRGVAGVPDTTAVSAVVLNVSTFNQDASGYLVEYPWGQARPPTSSMNYGAGRMQTQMVLATTSANGYGTFYTSAATDMLVDVAGYYIQGAGSLFVPVAPTRVIDTRYAAGMGIGPITGPLGANTNTPITLTGTAGVPTSGVTAVMIDAVADAGSASAGWLSFWASGDAQPGALSLTYYPNEDTANLVNAKVGSDGKAIVTNYTGVTDLVVDVVGYFLTPVPPAAPDNVVALPGDGSATVSWIAPASTGGVALTANVAVAYAYPAMTQMASVSVCATCTTASFSGLTNGSTYQFGVYAQNPAGNGPSASSNVITVAPPDPLAGAGVTPWFTYDAYGLNDRLSAQVNVGTGNLVVSAADLTVPMVGGAHSLARTYNSLAAGSSSPLFGYGWRFDDAPDHRLEPQADGSVRYVSPDGNASVFRGPSLTTPPGVDVTLVHNGDGTYTLSVHGSAEVLSFRADGLLVSDADAYGNALTFSYPPGGGYEASTTGTAGTSPGNTVTVTYGGPGAKVSSLAQTADGVTRSVGYDYDAAGNLWHVTDPAGGVTTFSYDGAHNLTQIAAPGGQLQFGYDGAHRVVSVTRPIPGDTTAVTRYDYSTPGHTKVTDADGHPPTDLRVDGVGRLLAVTDAKNPNAATVAVYTADYKLRRAVNASGGVTDNDWSDNGGESLRSSTNPTGAKVVNEYGNTGLLKWSPKTVTDTMANKAAIGYNDTIPDPRTVQNTTTSAWGLTLYNPDGTVSSSTDPNNVTTDLLHLFGQDTTKSTRYAYFPTHQLQSITPPAGTSLGARSFTYDGAGRLHTATSGGGVTVTFAYDALDRLTGETFSDATHPLVLGYDANGNLNSRADATGTTLWSYDAASRLKSKTLPDGTTMFYGYDPVGNLVTVTDAAGITGYHYDKVNELDQITEPSGRKDVFAYDADHRRTDAWDATGAVTYDASGNTVVAPTSFALHIHSRYDPAGDLAEIRTTHASSDADGARLADIIYTYIVPPGTTCPGATVGTPTDKRQTANDLLATKLTSYCYDSSARLTKAATSNGGPTYTYGYDADGNRTTDAAGTHTFNAANQLTDTGVTFDADGNMLSSSAYPNLAYNSIDQTTSITRAGQAAVPFTYAGTGQAERTSAGATTSANGMLGVQSETTGGATTNYVRTPGGGLVYEHTPVGDYYYYFDGLGSVIGLVDATNGNQRASYTYDPYGANATATAANGSLPPNPWRWAGGYLDATGLYHFGARYYDPVIGRFTQVDPVQTGSCSTYDYSCGDPVNHGDLDGRCLFGKRKHGGCRGANKFTDYVQGSDSDKRTTDPNYTNSFSDAEEAVAKSSAVRYFQACVSGASSSAVTGAVAGPEGALSSAGFGCGMAIAETTVKDNTPISHRAVDAVGNDVSAFASGYTVGKVIFERAL